MTQVALAWQRVCKSTVRPDIATMDSQSETGSNGWVCTAGGGVGYDPNERKYFVSPQSVELAIAEERAKAAKINDAEAFGKDSESFRTVPHDSEIGKKPAPASEDDASQIKELERENLDLKITNRAKDIVIERIQNERETFFNQLLMANRKMGELENKLLQLGAPEKNPGADQVL
jgi:hypothetical protein